MIARIFPAATSFLRVCRYVCQDQERSEVLEVEGVRGHNHRVMAEDFEIIHALRPGREHVVFHAIMDFHADEKMDNARMVQMAREYLEGIGRTDTQYAIVRHTDTAHPHIHIVANRIDREGVFDSGFPERLKNKDISQKLILKHHLIPVKKKDLAHTNRQALDGREACIYKIYEHIAGQLPLCTSLEELEQRLSARGIHVRYRYNEDTGQREGVSFKLGKYAFKGSRVDRAYSLQRLEETLAQRHEIALWEHKQLALREPWQPEDQNRKTELRQEEEHMQRIRQKPDGEEDNEPIQRHVHRIRIS